VLASLGEKAIWLRGNCERAVVEVFDGRYRPTVQPTSPVSSGRERAAERLRASAWPGTADFVEQNVLHGPPSDTEALALFSDWAKRRRSR
jgi:hypothetical protein